MLPLAHLGIGLKITKPFSRGVSFRWILLGTLLPDLIDKVLFYSDLMKSTRTFGHWGLSSLSLAFLGGILGRPLLMALALGMASHLVLDSIFYPTPEALLWPLLGPWPLPPFEKLQDHLFLYLKPLPVGLEILGALLLIDEIGQRRGWFLRRRRRSF